LGRVGSGHSTKAVCDATRASFDSAGSDYAPPLGPDFTAHVGLFRGSFTAECKPAPQGGAHTSRSSTPTHRPTLRKHFLDLSEEIAFAQPSSAQVVLLYRRGWSTSWRSSPMRSTRGSAPTLGAIDARYTARSRLCSTWSVRSWCVRSRLVERTSI
jgi:hypothetical protein